MVGGLALPIMAYAVLSYVQLNSHVSASISRCVPKLASPGRRANSAISNPQNITFQ